MEKALNLFWILYSRCAHARPPRSAQPHNRTTGISCNRLLTISKYQRTGSDYPTTTTAGGQELKETVTLASMCQDSTWGTTSPPSRRWRQCTKQGFPLSRSNISVFFLAFTLIYSFAALEFKIQNDIWYILQWWMEKALSLFESYIQCPIVECMHKLCRLLVVMTTSTH